MPADLRGVLGRIAATARSLAIPAARGRERVPSNLPLALSAENRAWSSKPICGDDTGMLGGSLVLLAARQECALIGGQRATNPYGGKSQTQYNGRSVEKADQGTPNQLNSTL